MAPRKPQTGAEQVSAADSADVTLPAGATTAPATRQDEVDTGRAVAAPANVPDVSESSAAATQHPPFWIADRVLPVGSEMGDGMPARAFSAGDRVPAEHVERFGWQEYVSAPEGDWPPPVAPAEPEATSTAAQPGSGKE